MPHPEESATNDDGFFEETASFGLVVYSQFEAPQPSNIVDAVIAIDRVSDRDSRRSSSFPCDELRHSANGQVSEHPVGYDNPYGSHDESLGTVPGGSIHIR
jgi:hypothetical protein